MRSENHFLQTVITCAHWRFSQFSRQLVPSITVAINQFTALSRGVICSNRSLRTLYLGARIPLTLITVRFIREGHQSLSQRTKLLRQRGRRGQLAVESVPKSREPASLRTDTRGIGFSFLKDFTGSISLFFFLSLSCSLRFPPTFSSHVSLPPGVLSDFVQAASSYCFRTFRRRGFESRLRVTVGIDVRLGVSEQ